VLKARGLPLPNLEAAIPPGLPAFALPQIDWPLLTELAPIAAAIALVAAADTSVLSRAFPGPDGQPSPPNRELVALGLANLAAGLFQGMPVSSSSTRTPIVAAAGARSQVAGLVAAGVVAGLIALAPGLSALIPKPALAAVVIAACGAILDLGGFWQLARVRPGEFVVSAVCLAGVVLLGVLPGIVAAVALSLTDFIWRSWRPYDAVLGRVQGVKGYHDISRHPDAALIPGLIIFRWDAPLFFANAGMFRSRLLAAIVASPTPVREVIVAAEPITDIDTTAADMLCQLADELRGRGIEIAFAELKGPAKDELKRYGLFDRFGPAAFYPTLGRAVSRYLHDHDVAWQDWSE
jgi:MFS superfamily sulfate permease-like transporter